jgi:hypothetical protein
MLDALDSIDWSSITHAYGPATDVPEAIRSLVSVNEEQRTEALTVLHQTIWHQGTIYPATAAVVPFLYELLNHPDVRDKEGIVSILGCIATGESVLAYLLRNDGEAVVRQKLAKEGKTLEQALAEEAAMMAAIHDAVSAGLPYLLLYLNGSDILRMVADAFGSFPEHSSWLLPAIDEALASDYDDQLRRILAEAKIQLITGSPPELPKDATTAERAQWIFSHSRNSFDDGYRVVEILLAGREISELPSEELLLLAQGYNWWCKQAKAFETAKVGLAREPHIVEWLDLAGRYLRYAYVNDLPRFLTACDACVAEGVGPPAFWHLLKADQFIAIATGERELDAFKWSPGHAILHPELLRPATEALESALATDPDLREQGDARGWIGDWNKRFAAVLQTSEFRHLAAHHTP